MYDLPLDDWRTFENRIAAIDAAAVAGVVQRQLDPARLVWVIVGDYAVIGAAIADFRAGEFPGF